MTVRMQVVDDADCFGLVTACAVATASAQEKPIELATGPGREIVEKYCGSSCHSLDYRHVPMAALQLVQQFGRTLEEGPARQLLGPKRRFAAPQRYVSNWGYSGPAWCMLETTQLTCFVLYWSPNKAATAMVAR